jgi:tRNA threonylcarbamoyladenosine biosynthesis protein TsaE
MTFVSESPRDTFDWAAAFARSLAAGDVVCLTGELGSGKTVFVQGAAAGLGVAGPVTSPTFTLVQEYRGRLPVFHFDFYRLEGGREVEGLDLPWYFEAGGVSLIEWAERAGDLLPADRFDVRLSRAFAAGRPVPERRILEVTFPPGRGDAGGGR